jgi:hypothetical protein
MAIKYNKITRPSQIYPKWDFWFENIPSGNPDYVKFVYQGAQALGLASFLLKG